jgi:predicted membrane protein
LIDLIGVTAMGLMWGWLMVLIWGRPSATRPYLNLLAILSATILFAAMISLMTTPHLVINFLIAALVMAVLHFSWIRSVIGEQ